MTRQLIDVGLVVLILAPCPAWSQDRGSAPAAAATAASDALARDTGTVVFFREKMFAGSFVHYKVREKGVELCKLLSGTYCTIQVSAGKHAYEVHSEAKDVLNLEVDPGETYYVIGGVSMGVFAGHPNLSPSSKTVFDGMKDKLKDNTGKNLRGPKSKEDTTQVTERSGN